ncbi:DUF881 domain-containing protein [Cellulomonas sp. P22]|uniref:DUF881 domain-containing protein n=1 Tax=Cellulomonas sp. P22 TaxID=3373189 RepID=UPI00379E7177
MTSEGARRPVDASMTLLHEVVSKPLDPGYRMVADRRALHGEPARSPARAVGLLMVALALGLGTTAATLALRAPEPAVVAARTLLEDQILERSADMEDLHARSSELTSEIAQLQTSVLAAAGSPLVDQLEADSLASGAVPVTGPGLRITLTDPPDAALEDDALAKVLERDVQMVVNGLWDAGAEAVAVNNQRLTSTTAIREAGGSIMVDVVPLIGPYVIEAIGDPQDLQVALARSTAGQYMVGLRIDPGLGVEISPQTSLSLARATTVTFRSAVVPEGVPVLAAGPGPRG